MATLFDVQRLPRRSLVSLMTKINKDCNEFYRYESFNGAIGSTTTPQQPFYDSKNNPANSLQNFHAVSSKGLSINT